MEYDVAIKAIEKILSKNSTERTEDALQKLGFLYDHAALRQSTIKKKQLEEKAISLYQEVLAINPQSYRALWGIGRVWWHRKNKKAISYALKAYHLKRKLKKKSGLYPQNIGLIYEALGNMRRAEYWLLRGLKENKKDFGSYLNLVVFYRFVKKFDKAKKYAKQLEFHFKRTPKKFQDTPWGKKINEVIAEADQPLRTVGKI